MHAVLAAWDEVPFVDVLFAPLETFGIAVGCVLCGRKKSIVDKWDPGML